MSSPAAAPRRNPVVVVIDVIAGVVAIAIGIGMALTAISYGIAFSQQGTGSLTAIGIGLIIVTVLAVFLGIGMFVVALIRKRLSFYWPLGAFVVMLIAFYIAAALAGAALA